jgi:hypothetical protein
VADSIDSDVIVAMDTMVVMVDTIIMDMDMDIVDITIVYISIMEGMVRGISTTTMCISMCHQTSIQDIRHLPFQVL